jgi:hypothetical protein
MTPTLIDDRIYDVLSSHLYPARTTTSMYVNVPYETVLANKKVSIINTNWAPLLLRWVKGENTSKDIFSSPLYRYLRSMDSDTSVIFNHAFEAYHMHMFLDLRERFRKILDHTPDRKYILLTHNRDVFQKHNGWENRLNLVEYNALFRTYYNTRVRIEDIHMGLRRKHFTTLCGTVRRHRSDLYIFLRTEDLLDKTHYTFNGILTGPQWIEGYNKEHVYSQDYHDFLRADPVSRKTEDNLKGYLVQQKTELHNTLPVYYWTDSYVHLVTETCFDSGDYVTGTARDFFTEKSMKVYDNYQIPIMLSTPGMVEYHRKNGYDVFDDVIDHSYDKIENSKERFDAVAKEIRRISKMTRMQLHKLYHKHRDSLIHNRQNLHRHYGRVHEQADAELLRVLND